MADEAQRGVIFTLKVQTDKSVGEAFLGIEKQVAELQKKLNLRMGMAAQVATAYGNGQTIGGRAIGPGGGAYGNGNGNGHPNGHQPQYASRGGTSGGASAYRGNGPVGFAAGVPTSRMPGTSEVDRIQRERMAALKKQQWFDSDYWRSFEQYGQGTARAREKEEKRQEKERRELDKIQQQRMRDLQRQQKTDADYWSGVEKYGQKTKDARDKAEAKQREREKTAADRDLNRRITAGNRQLSSLVRSGGQAQHEDRLSANARMTGYERDQEQLARQAEVSQAREREEINRTREATLSATEAITKMGEGLSMLGLIGERDIKKLADRLLLIQGIARTVTGFAGLPGGRAGGIGGLGGVPLRNLSAGASALRGFGGGIIGAAGNFAVPALLAGGAHLAMHDATQNVYQAPSRTMSERLSSLGYNFTENLGDFGHRVASFIRPDAIADLKQAQYNRRYQMEDVREGGASTGEQAARTRRNTERLGRIAQQQAEQRALRRDIGSLGMGVDIQRAQSAREVAEQQFQIDLYRRQPRYQQDISARYLSGQTNIGQATGFLGPRNAFSNANAILDPAERMRFLQGRRDFDVTHTAERFRIEQQLRMNESQQTSIRAAQQRAMTPGEENPQVAEAAGRELKRLDEERLRLTRERGELTQKINQQDLADMQKLTQEMHNRSKVARQQMIGASKGLRGEKARLGMMTPMELEALAQAKKMAQSGQELTLHQIEVLQNGDAESRRLAETQAVRRFEKSGHDRNFLETERAEREAAAGRFGEFSTKAQRMEQEMAASGRVNQVEVGGGFNVTVDVKPDMSSIEQTTGQMEEQFKNMIHESIAQVMDAVEKVARDQAEGFQRMNQQRKSGAEG